MSSIAAIIGPLLYNGLFARFTAPKMARPFPAAPLVASAAIALTMLVVFLRTARHTRA